MPVFSPALDTFCSDNNASSAFNKLRLIFLILAILIMIIYYINEINYTINVQLYTSKKASGLIIMQINCYDEDWNPHYFFQPASTKEPVGVTLRNQSDTSPSPMEKHRIP